MAKKADPNVESVQVDVDAEIIRLANMDGIKQIAQLDVKVEVTRRQRYRDSVVAYYRGRDDGYAEGVSMIGVPVTKALRRNLLVGFLVGFPLGSAAVAAILHFIK